MRVSISTCIMSYKKPDVVMTEFFQVASCFVLFIGISFEVKSFDSPVTRVRPRTSASCILGSVTPFTCSCVSVSLIPFLGLQCSCLYRTLSRYCFRWFCSVIVMFMLDERFKSNQLNSLLNAGGHQRLFIRQTKAFIIRS